MQKVHIDYINSEFEWIKEAIARRVDRPESSMLLEWRRFERNITKHFSTREPSWAFWQYEQALFSQALAVVESGCVSLEYMLRKNPVPEGYIGTPGIVGTFHSGSYRVLAKWLVLSGLRVKLVVSSEVKRQQEPLFFREIEACLSHPDDFGVLDAGDPRITFKVRDALSEGFMVLIYLDGNVGHSGRRTVEVPLFDAHIILRQGAADLARIFEVPVYPIFCTRERGGLEYFLFPPVNPSLECLAGLKAGEITTDLFYSFLQLVSDRPYLWENWFFMDEFTSRNEV